MQLVIVLLCYLGAGISTNLFLFHVPVARKRLDPAAERLRIARSIAPLEKLRIESGDEAAQRAVAVGTVLLWPLFVVPLLKWMSEIER